MRGGQVSTQRTHATLNLARFVLGLRQMGGSVVSALLLYSTGVTTVSLAAAIGTTSLTVLSRALFRERRQ